MIQVLPKSDLIDRLARQAEMPREQVGRLLEALATVTAETLQEGMDLRLPGIGTLRQRRLGARSGTTPNGQPFRIATSVRVGLRPAARLLEQLNQEPTP